jgi:hypothetical protein
MKKSHYTSRTEYPQYRGLNRDQLCMALEDLRCEKIDGIITAQEYEKREAFIHQELALKR